MKYDLGYRLDPVTQGMLWRNLVNRLGARVPCYVKRAPSVAVVIGGLRGNLRENLREYR